MGGAKKKEVSSSSEDSDDDNEESDDESHLRVKLDGSFNNTTTYQLPRYWSNFLIIVIFDISKKIKDSKTQNFALL